MKKFKSEVEDLICNELISKGYVLEPKKQQEHLTPIQSVFHIFHPDWLKEENKGYGTFLQELNFYSNSVSVGMGHSTLGIDFLTKEKHSFGMFHNEEIFKLILNKLENYDAKN